MTKKEFITLNKIDTQIYNAKWDLKCKFENNKKDLECKDCINYKVCIAINEAQKLTYELIKQYHEKRG